MHVHVWRSEEACARVEVTGGVCMCGGQRKRVHVWRSEEACARVGVRGHLWNWFSLSTFTLVLGWNSGCRSCSESTLHTELSHGLIYLMLCDGLSLNLTLIS